jgi:hypothetical protein
MFLTGHDPNGHFRRLEWAPNAVVVLEELAESAKHYGSRNSSLENGFRWIIEKLMVFCAQQIGRSAYEQQAAARWFVRYKHLADLLTM